MNKLYLSFPKMYQKLYVFLREKILLYKEVERYVPRKGIIYDLGAGYGILSYYIAQKSSERSVIGFDLNKKRVQVANEVFKDQLNVSFSTKDLRNYPDIKKCECIILYDFLHHIPYESQKKIICACTDYLKKDGILIIKEIDSSIRLKLFYTWILDKIVTKGDPLFFSAEKDLNSYIKSLNFKIEKIRIDKGKPYPHYLLVCKKNQKKTNNNI
jgi:2-polyprenyl-3-methyl-5-hydroxy-6-metoxy-1,4-benzoquinol methylase